MTKLSLFPVAGTRVSAPMQLPLRSQPAPLGFHSPRPVLPLRKLSTSVRTMARNPPYRNRGGRSSATSRSHRSSNTRRTSISASDARHSSTRPASSVSAGPSKSHKEIHPGSLPDTSINTPSEARNDAEENDDTLIEVIMAVDMTPRGTVGCCYYVARDEKLYFMEDIQCGDVHIIDSRMFYPTDHQVTTLTSS